jgi:hypothetical protein
MCRNSRNSHKAIFLNFQLIVSNAFSKSIDKTIHERLSSSARSITSRRLLILSPIYRPFIKPKRKEIKLTQYADDTQILLDGSEKSVRNTVNLLNNFTINLLDLPFAELLPSLFLAVYYPTEN